MFFKVDNITIIGYAIVNVLIHREIYFRVKKISWHQIKTFLFSN